MARTLVCLKYFLKYCIVILGILEILVCAAAIFCIYQLNQFEPLAPKNTTGPATLIIIISISIWILSCCGWQIMDFSNRTQITIFNHVLFTATLMNAAIGVWALVKLEKTDFPPDAFLQQIILDIGDDKRMDHIHVKLRCCGVYAPTNYVKRIPPSCHDESSRFTRGCVYEVLNHARSVLLRVFVLAVCAGVLKTITLATSLSYSSTMKEAVTRRRELVARTDSLKPNDNIKYSAVLTSESKENETP